METFLALGGIGTGAFLFRNFLNPGCCISRYQHPPKTEEQHYIGLRSSVLSDVAALSYGANVGPRGP